MVRRADARRNRERILEAALAELTRDACAPLSVIRRRAGVGQATFYRNFPDRDALVLELYGHEIRQVARAATELLATRPPDQALREWLDRLARFTLTKTGLAEALRHATRAPGAPDKPSYAPVEDAVRLLLRANEQAGTVRPGLTPEDFFLATAGIWQLDPTADDWPARTARLLDLVLYGLRSRPGDRPADDPGSPDSPDD
ncbi:TetR/AcrR family transcriptional regulator [Streptomyces sp. Z26]|nr:TetR/AcrR family transcriptional regulator [Streptomyces sp. Z26]